MLVPAVGPPARYRVDALVIVTDAFAADNVGAASVLIAEFVIVEDASAILSLYVCVVVLMPTPATLLRL